MGSRLLEQLLDHARKYGLKDVYLTTTQYHKAAIALYKKAGFKLVEEMPLMGTAKVLMFKLDL
jgi:N-acetylglutamate synthase-like GNAT family acetyltransferase